MYRLLPSSSMSLSLMYWEELYPLWQLPNRSNALANWSALFSAEDFDGGWWRDTALMLSNKVMILEGWNSTQQVRKCCCCFFVFFYKTTSGCIYLQKLVDVVPNKGTPLVSLAFHIKLVKAFVQNTIVGSFGVVKPFLEDSLKIIYLTFLLYYKTMVICNIYMY